MCREAANSDSRKAMEADGIKGIHSSNHNASATGDGQQDINQPQGFRRFRNSRAHFVMSLRGSGIYAIELRIPPTSDST